MEGVSKVMRGSDLPFFQGKVRRARNERAWAWNGAINGRHALSSCPVVVS
jgi:hypothetical protein